MSKFSRSFIIEATEVLTGEVKEFDSFAAAAEGMQIGIKWIKKQIRENGGTSLRGTDGRLWTCKIKFNVACKLIPCFDGIPIQYCASYSSAIALLNVSSRTFYKHMGSVPLGENFTIKDCFKRDWICICYRAKQSYPFASNKKVAV